MLVQGFFGVWFFAPIQSSLSLEIWSTPPKVIELYCVMCEAVLD